MAPSYPTERLACYFFALVTLLFAGHLWHVTFLLEEIIPRKERAVSADQTPSVQVWGLSNRTVDDTSVHMPCLPNLNVTFLCGPGNVVAVHLCSPLSWQSTENNHLLPFLLILKRKECRCGIKSGILLWAPVFVSSMRGLGTFTKVFASTQICKFINFEENLRQNFPLKRVEPCASKSDACDLSRGSFSA